MKKSLERAEASLPELPEENRTGEESTEPSWFLQSGNQQTREDLMKRYRSARNLGDPSERPAETERYGQPRYRQLISTRALPPSHFLSEGAEHESVPLHKPSRPREGGLSLVSTFVLAASMAALSGGTIGFIAAKVGSDGGQTMLLAADAEPESNRVSLNSVQELPKSAPASVPKKNVATASLKVADVSGETNSFIPLSLHAEPAFAGQDLLLKISGLPENAYLTTGRRQGDKVWTLSPLDVKDAKVMIPDATDREIDLSVGAFEPKSGELAAPIQNMKIELSNVRVEPVSAPPPAMGKLGAIPKPTGSGVTQAANQHAADESLRKADSLFNSGEVAAARQAYQTAWTKGSVEGALGLARSYDPVVLSSMKAVAGNPDRSQALQWYERAAVAGNDEALSAIVRLRLKPN